MVLKSTRFFGQFSQYAAKSMNSLIGKKSCILIPHHLKIHSQVPFAKSQLMKRWNIDFSHVRVLLILLDHPLYFSRLVESYQITHWSNHEPPHHSRSTLRHNDPSRKRRTTTGRGGVHGCCPWPRRPRPANSLRESFSGDSNWL
ncbi:unnamed protein product [Lactuca saligna]|uniref:Uncharacterized protein n=1 Tax=Lactuca saligna TaxID=75948 RepID=A0AA35ZB55_LACSI|nr:unnamed protein product [Lactuca saligna]